ncbi:Pleckstrin homology domain-domain-containing protein [Syncephalastrum racemosum]|uniref:Pleckstrin homology domain-domain-containing protein n=1 Tax=Syncephalastrum racemosum TaxID=13706 RepID=A0A1X2HT91_SYNRA|nr:Pleckstrin homology domain-domain-containing protein [Syncephalastrum racemosum]
MAENDVYEHRRQCGQRLLIGEPTKHTLPNLFKTPRSPSTSAALVNEQDDGIEHNVPIADFVQETRASESSQSGAYSFHTAHTEPDNFPQNSDNNANVNYGDNNDNSPVVNKPLPKLDDRKTKLLFWRRSGAVFLPPLSRPSIEEPGGWTSEKEGVLLCMRTLGDKGSDDQKTRYKARREARYGKLKEDWRQMEIVLTMNSLCMYTRPLISWPKRRLEHCIDFKTAKQLHLSLVSPLDYTFSLRFASRKASEFVTFTFQAPSMTLCQEWYLALYRLIPATARRSCPLWCEVHIPLMDTSVRLPLAVGSSSDDNIRYDITLESIRQAVLNVLEHDETWSKLVATQLDRTDLSMCWTRQNRVEWVHWTTALESPRRRIDLVVCPQHIEQTHRLELRHIQHTPDTVVTKDETALKEPQPIEGYLLRLTSFSGKPMSARGLSRRNYYFASFDQYLVYDNHPKNPIPQAIQEQPNSCISIIQNGPRSEHARAESERRTLLLTGAIGMVDLTEMASVRKSFRYLDYDVVGGYSTSDSSLNDSLSPVLGSQQEEPAPSRRNSTEVPHETACFDIVMENGLILKLQAPSATTCDAWVRHLNELMIYWKARKEAVRLIHAKHCYSDTLEEAFRTRATGEGSHAWFNQVPEVDTRIWSYCVFDQCRDIVKSGTMYFQPRARGTFSKKTFLLSSNGWLLFYNTYERSQMTSQPLLTAKHTLKGILDIADCYVYSGSLSLCGRKSAEHALDKRPPRIFGDGVATSDPDEACVFTLWKPQHRTWFSPKKKRVIQYKTSKRLLPSDGQAWHFAARSQEDKQEWVWAIRVVIEHMLRTQTASDETGGRRASS